MFFKNILLYRLVDKFQYNENDFNELLKANIFLPCPRSENSSIGWISPFGDQQEEMLVHGLKGYLLFAFCKEEKLLPSAIIKEELNKKIKELEHDEGREIYKKEKSQLKEEVIINLRYQAFSRKKITYAYIDIVNNCLIINTASRNRAEELCTLLRKSLGSLKLSLPQTISKPETVMTAWLREKKELPFFKIEHNCDLLDPRQKTSMIKCKEHDLNAEEILMHVNSGKQVVKIALNWNEKISFELSDDLTIKKIKFLELLKKQREEVDSQSLQDQIDADFALMSGEFSQFLAHLWPLFNGLVEPQ